MTEDIDLNTVKEAESIAVALRKMNTPEHWRTLFVLDASGRVVGSISDGDIRRGLLQGLSPTNNCGEFMHKNFSSFRRGEISIERVVEFRERGICIVPMLDEDGHLRNS